MINCFLIKLNLIRKLEQLKFLIIIEFIISASNVSAQTEYKFIRPELNEQLSHNSVQCIYQDSYGFIWFGTEGGLNKYDGYNITEYTHDLDDSNSISNNHVLTIYEDIADSGKILWLGTNDGLIKFDRYAEVFYTYKIDENIGSSQQQNLIKYICDDGNGSFWLGGNGLKKFNKQTGRTKQVLKNFKTLFVYSISIENEILWLGTTEGLIRFDQKTENYKIYQLHTDNPHNVNRNTISAHQPDSNKIWIGTYEGLYVFDTKTENFTRPKFLVGNPNFSLVNELKKDQFNNIWIANGLLYKLTPSRDSLLEYSHGLSLDAYSATRLSSFCINESRIIWIGLVKNGVIKGNPIRKKFYHFNYVPQNPMSLNFNDITSFMEDDLGFMWIGASLGGLNKFNKKTKKFYIAGGSPVALNITKSSDGVLWYSSIGCMVAYNPITNGGGAFFGKGIMEDNAGVCTIYEDQEKNIAQRKFLLDRAIKKNLVEMRDAGNGIFFCFIDSKDSIWVLTGPGRKINKFNLKKMVYTPYTIKTDEDISNSIQFMFEDKNKNLWFGTNGKGLIKRIKNESDEIKYIHYKNKSDFNSISSNIINTICEDKRGYLWIGTDLGLNKFDPISNTFERFTVKDGLPSNLVAGVIVDNEGKIWISTNKGISRYNVNSSTFTNYDKGYGLQSNTFNLRSCYKDSEGYLYFGGANGFNMFKPEDIKENPNAPRTYIVDLQIYNQSLNIGKDLPLKKSIEFSDEITLNHVQNVLTFEFAALEYTNPENNLYRYIMEGVDPDWVETKADRRFASYTQLSPGNYKFRVIGSNNDGIWSEKEAVINITILPPWWKTDLAYLFYFLIAIGFVYLIWKIRITQLNLQHQAELDHLNAEKFEEMDRLKSRFFANISHEFRTPLTLILGPVNNLIEKIKDNSIKIELKIVKRNANRLLQLVNQLLDLSKIESGRKYLKTSYENIIPLLNGMVLSFAPLAESKKIKLSFNTEITELFIYIDRDILGKIINNLLSNAFKFTNSEGQINVTLKEVDEYAEITVSDTGIGICEDKIKKIFDRFYQVDESKTREYEGTGIGLSLTKELVELHKGEIFVKSEEKIGTTFTVRLPLGKDYLKEDEIIDKVKTDSLEYEIPEISAYFPEALDTKINTDFIVHTDKPLILITEDNNDVREYVKGYFEEDYIVLEAVDGEDGLNKAFEYIPDLIISDIMMPQMDGYEFCGKLKEDEKTSHIPIILLTAKATSKDKIDGLETGADDYLTKPFDAKELQVRTKNLIQQRKRLREHLKKEGLFDFQTDDISSTDKQFIKKIIETINFNISDETFGVDILSQEAAMSRSQLHRKLIALIDESPGDLIRRIRMTKAVKLIKEKFGNISEIALEVGYTNPANFTRSFTKQYGISPSEYQHR